MPFNWCPFYFYFFSLLLLLLPPLLPWPCHSHMLNRFFLLVSTNLFKFQELYRLPWAVVIPSFSLTKERFTLAVIIAVASWAWDTSAPPIQTRCLVSPRKTKSFAECFLFGCSRLTLPTCTAVHTPGPCKKVAAGDEFSVILTNKGMLCAFGHPGKWGGEKFLDIVLPQAWKCNYVYSSDSHSVSLQLTLLPFCLYLFNFFPLFPTSFASFLFLFL